MKKTIAILSFGTLSALLFTASASAANWYVRPGGTGSKTGADWNNAWDVGSIGWSQVKGGDTVWLAGGTYTSQVFPAASGSAANPIVLKRVQATDSVPSAAAGWQASFDQQVIIAPGSIPIIGWLTSGQGNYMYIDGRVDSGISLQNRNNVAGYDYFGPLNIGGVGSPSACHDITLTNIESAGPEGSTGITHASYDNCIQIYTGYNIFIYNCRFHGGNENANINSASNVLFDHCKWYDNNGSGAGHANMIECSSLSNVTWRYNEWWNWGIEGWIFPGGGGAGNGIYIYGCVFHDAANSVPRILAFEVVQNNLYFYNNTCVNIPFSPFYDSSGSGYWNGGEGNNIYWNINGGGGMGNQFPSFADYDYSDVSLGETHGVTGTGASPFVNYSGTNYQIVRTIASNYPRSKGENLGSPYNIDFLGVTRPASGAWDIGAYESGGSSSTNPVISISPSTLTFGAVLTNTTATNTFTVQNAGAGTLAGTATVPAPFRIVSGGAYSLGAGQSQTVLIAFSPGSSTNANNQIVTFTGGGGATAAISGSGMLLALVPGLSFPSYAGTITAPMVTNSGGYIYTTQDVSGEGQSGVGLGGSATYSFTITNAGQYTISANVNAPNAGSKSFWVNIDSSPTDPTMIWDVYPYTTGFQLETVSWRGSGTSTNDQFSPEIFNLTSGVHQLIIDGREANVQLGQITIQPYSASRSGAPQPPASLRIAAQ